MPWAKAWGAVDLRTNRMKYDFPPTVYYAMARDQQTMQQIQEGIQILRENGVPSDYVFVSGGAGTRVERGGSIESCCNTSQRLAGFAQLDHPHMLILCL